MPLKHLTSKPVKMATSLKILVGRNGEPNQNGKYSLYLRIVHGRKKSDGKINMPPISKLHRDTWNAPTQRFSNRLLKNYNGLINDIENNFEQYLRLNQETIPNTTAKEIVNILLKRNLKESETLTHVSTDFIEKTILPDINLAAGTKRNYQKSVKHLQKYLKYKKLETLKIECFNGKEASLFIEYLHSEIEEINKKPLTRISSHSIIKNLKPLFNKLMLEETISKNPFTGIKIKFDITEKPRLPFDAFIELTELNIHEENKLSVYRDIFLLMCYTGLSHCDLFNLKRDVINNNFYIDTRRLKTNTMVRQIMIQPAQDILNKYLNHPDTVITNSIIPKRSLDKLNLNLKIIGAMVGLDFALASYASRRFFRQSIAAAGIHEPFVVKSLMGHSTKGSMDAHYLIVTDEMLTEAKLKLENIHQLLTNKKS